MDTDKPAYKTDTFRMMVMKVGRVVCQQVPAASLLVLHYGPCAGCSLLQEVLPRLGEAPVPPRQLGFLYVSRLCVLAMLFGQTIS